MVVSVENVSSDPFIPLQIYNSYFVVLSGTIEIENLESRIG